MCKAKKIEFYVSPNGRVMVDEEGDPVQREFTENEQELTNFMLDLIMTQYPAAYKALCKEYEKSSPNKRHYNYLRVHRFIRCNFGKFDGLTWDIEGNVLHLEDIACPLKWCGECKMYGVICKPQPFGLTTREAMVAKMSSTGRTYDEISEELGITHSTIKNTIQKVKEKLHLSSSKEIAKLIIATL